MNKKSVIALSLLVAISALIGIVYADNDHDLSIDGFNNCKITVNEIVSCIGFNTLHNDNKQIETMLLTEIQNQKTIINQNAEIISLMTPKAEPIQGSIIDGKTCYKSGTGKICDP